MTKRQRTRRPRQDQEMNNSSSPVIRDVRLEWTQDSLQVQTIHSNEHDRYRELEFPRLMNFANALPWFLDEDARPNLPH